MRESGNRKHTPDILDVEEVQKPQAAVAELILLSLQRGA